ncbi:MAG: S-layer homology domain-containing protein [Eubacteriales bacterium]|nr:S-layer homology domain-containing protein [Eubacteriales bacterium]
MKWTKRLGSALLAGAMAVTVLSSGALAGGGPEGYDFNDDFDQHIPAYSSDYVLVKETTYDDDGITSYAVYENNQAGKIVKKTAYYGVGKDYTQTQTTTYTYGADGKISEMKISEESGLRDTIYTRDSAGNIIREKVTDFYVDGTSYEEIYTYKYDQHNQIIEKTITFLDDETRQEVSVTEERKNSYDAKGNLTKTEIYYSEENGEQYLEKWYTYEYDANNRLIQRTDHYDNGERIVSEVNQKYTYDSNGNEVSHIYYDQRVVYEYQKVEKATPVYEIFHDISAGAWYTEAVQYVYDNGIMKGMGDSTFAPSVSMTRAMVAQIMYAQAGSPAVSGDMPFRDVSSSKWYYNAILWANQNGVVAGMGDGTFAPNSNITREQYAAILYRYEKSPAVSGSLNFPDASSVSSWAITAVLWANQNGIINGTVDNGVTKLDPKGTATRAQSAVILMGYLEK